MLLSLLLLFQGITPQQWDIEEEVTLNYERTHETAQNPILDIMRADIPGDMVQLSVGADVTTDIHMTWTNPSIWNRTVRLHFKYNVWNDPQPNIPSHYSTNGIYPTVNPPPPLNLIGTLAEFTTSWQTVTPGVQEYLFLTETFTGGQVSTILSPGTDNPSIYFGDAYGGLSVTLEELHSTGNISEVTDGSFLWPFTTVRINNTRYNYTWDPAPLTQGSICFKEGNAEIGGIPSSVWGMAEGLNTNPGSQYLGMWIGSGVHSLPTTTSSVLCANGPWVRLLDTLETFSGDSVNHFLQPDMNVGDIHYYQFWYRENGTGLMQSTDCIEVIF